MNENSLHQEKWRHERNSVEIAWANEQKADLNWLWRHIFVAKNLDEIRNQEKANNSRNYRCVAINEVIL